MFAFNFLFWLLGCAILGVGIWIRVDPSFQKYAGEGEGFNYLYTGAYILIAVGAVIMVIGFLGCCGAIRESQCMLATFFVFLFLIFAVLLGVGIWSVYMKDSLENEVSTVLNDRVAKYKTDQASQEFMDNIQINFNCCGADKGLEDYGASNAPASCMESSYNKPCTKELFAFFSENMVIIAGVAIGIGVVMLLGMVFSMMLCCAIREATC